MLNQIQLEIKTKWDVVNQNQIDLGDSQLYTSLP